MGVCLIDDLASSVSFLLSFISLTYTFMDFHFHSNLNRLLLVRVFHLGSLRIPFTRE